MKITLYIIFFAGILFGACQSTESIGGPEVDSCIIEAEILGQDVSRHICGGGYIIRTEDQQFAVLDLLNQDIVEDAFQLTIYDDPIKVYINFSDLEEEGCSDYRKMLHCISRRN